MDENKKPNGIKMWALLLLLLAMILCTIASSKKRSLCLYHCQNPGDIQPVYTGCGDL